MKMTLKRIFVILIFIVQALSAENIFADQTREAEFSFDSHTYFLISQEDVQDDSRNIANLYEYVSLNATKIKDTGFSVVFSGWGKLKTSNNEIGSEDDDRSNGDINAAYIDYTGKYSNFNVRLGKQAVLTNSGYEGISGLSIKHDLPYNFKVSGFAGMPEDLEETPQSGDLVSGGRISTGYQNRIEVGAGYLEETNNDFQYRRETSADLWIMPISVIELYGKMINNEITDENAYSSASTNLYLTKKVTLSAKYDNIAYKDYFDETSEVSTFNLFNQNDELEAYKGSVNVDISDRLSLSVDYKDYNFKDEEDATSFGGGCKANVDNVSSELAYHRTDSKDENEGYYDEVRFFVMYDNKATSVSCDATFDFFEKETFNRNTSASVVASAGHKVIDNLKLSIDMDYSRNPNYDENYKLFLRIEYFM